MAGSIVSEAIATQNLSKLYGRSTGVIDLNLSIRRGEIFGFLGPNGAGKTTTIRLLLGLIKPSSGEMWILGNRTKKLRSESANEIGYLPGDFGLYGELTGRDYLLHFARLRKGNDYRSTAKKLDILTSRFDISFDKKISTYSKGMKQVIGIIQAFMHDPQVVILDEPTSGLDPIMQERFYELLMNEKCAGRTIFLSSHVLSEVEKVCDRAGIIRHGRLIAVIEVDEYRTSPMKKISIVPRGEVLEAVSQLQRLSGAKAVNTDNRTVGFLFSGDMQTLVACMAKLTIDDMVCEAPDLEEAFYEYYYEDYKD